jgi:trehalose 6-phosphate synthase
MAGVVVVSNRGPRSFRLDETGRPVPTGTAGGLAGTLQPLLTGTGATWIAAAMSPADRLAAAQGLLSGDGINVVAVVPDDDEYRMAYDVVSNATLWFCHHHLWDLPRRPRFDRRWHEAWDAYRSLNERFAAAAAAEAPEDGIVLVQDYHLSLVGRMLTRARPDLRTVHFHHTPFGDPSALAVLPAAAAAELLAGLAGHRACGFHTRRWARAFEAAFADGELAPGVDAPPTFVAPLGPDPEAVTSEAAGPEVDRAAEQLEEQLAGCQLVVRVDRIELSKNIVRGLWALDELLETRPALRGRVVHLVLAYASREGLAEYLAYRSEIEHVVDVVNERWATSGWQPVVLDVADDRNRSLAALRRYDALLVNPVRDGLNLVAKEGPLVNRRDGVLVLSREAGAVDELGEQALVVNPYDVSATAAALDRALAMDPVERATRAAALRATVGARTAADWLADQLAAAG